MLIEETVAETLNDVRRKNCARYTLFHPA